MHEHEKCVELTAYVQSVKSVRLFAVCRVRSRKHNVSIVYMRMLYTYTVSV